MLYEIESTAWSRYTVTSLGCFIMADEEQEESTMENADRLSAQETAFLKKYFTLRKKCEQMQQVRISKRW